MATHLTGSPRRDIRLVVRWVLVLCTAWLIGDEINVIWGEGPLHSVVFGRVPSEIVLHLGALLCILRGVVSRDERLAWIVIGTAFLVWGSGDIYYQVKLAGLSEVPVPSPADIGYLVFYPLMFVGLILLFRARSGRTSIDQWLDGLTATLAAAGISAALGLDAVLGSIGGEPLAVATNLAYPVSDVLLLGLIAGAVVICGLRGSRAWVWAGLGVVLFCVADSAYLVASATGTYQPGTWYDTGWSAAPVLTAAGAWSNTSDRVAHKSRSTPWLLRIVMPMGFAVTSIGVLLYASAGEVTWWARALAAASLIAVLVRLVVTFHAHGEVIALREYEATTDALTGLPNRRALNADLRDAVTSERPAIVGIFDLDGFKHYNDTFGHQAGDALLARLGESLAASVAGCARAYRMGGDEFCVLADTGEHRCADDAIGLAADALSESGEGFVVGSSFGTARIPTEARDAESALRLADQRMYDHKGRGRVSAERQSRNVLIQALREQTPELCAHTEGVRDLAEAVARHMGLDEPEIERVAATADLHDIGKVAIPRSILDKPGPLDDSEWAFMRRHTIIGARIVAAAPALASVAVAVRATHERWDGHGYPDGLAADVIPLAARIVSVCDAFEAMTTTRPYSTSLPASEAMAELRRCSGRQFDPRVVAAFERIIAERSADRVLLAA